MVDKNSDYRHWSLPELDESETEEAQETTLFGKPANWYHREKEIVEEDVEEQPQPLTLDDIEAIRQSAYEDGFKEGKDAGFAQGLEDGKTQGLSEGHQQGLEQGTVQGLNEGQAQIDKQISRWQLLIERLHNPLEKLDDNVEYQLIRLATMLAEQITRCEVQSNPQIILQALKQAVEALPVSEQTLKILLHPDDLVFVQDAYSAEVCLQRGWDLQPEPALARGDCQIHTQTSSVDYAFSTRIEQVLKHFFQDNHTQLPQKNDDSSLLNDHPVENTVPAAEQAAPAETADSDKEVINE
ncbi:flagellar assembly protein FliH [Psychromonas ossibalaenae]|uniref:flagellar assembly protein FliH n=1 Tax=Psychromonas ossibalaenae TaxID=444922 RepID=UPI00035F2A56|nr:flagellar assembly protein FliH [Psychromonas ossibalaenae]